MHSLLIQEKQLTRAPNAVVVSQLSRHVINTNSIQNAHLNLAALAPTWWETQSQATPAASAQWMGLGARWSQHQTLPTMAEELWVRQLVMDMIMLCSKWITNHQHQCRHLKMKPLPGRLIINFYTLVNPYECRNSYWTVTHWEMWRGMSDWAPVLALSPISCGLGQCLWMSRREGDG